MRTFLNKFIDIDNLAYGIRNNNNLIKIRMHFENIIKPTEEKVAAKLKKQLCDDYEDPRQVT